MPLFQHSNNFDYTFKQYYSNLSEDEDTSLKSLKAKKQKRAGNDISAFFEKPKKQKKSISSSCVSQLTPEGTSYITTNSDDGAKASHLIKLELYDMNKLRGVAPTDYWKNAQIRVKYFTHSEGDELFQNSLDVIYNMTKQVADAAQCKKFFYATKDE